jgi:hypothetical protein
MQIFKIKMQVKDFKKNKHECYNIQSKQVIAR